MIFLSVGTREPFTRLVRAVDDWQGRAGAGAEILAQTADRGTRAYRPRHLKAVAWLSPAEYAARFDRAELIIAHAGMGTVLTALCKGKPIVVMPRRVRLGETRNDHQSATLEHLGPRPGLYVALDETSLAAMLWWATEAPGGNPVPRILGLAAPAFSDALRAFIVVRQAISPGSFPGLQNAVDKGGHEQPLRYPERG